MTVLGRGLIFQPVLVSLPYTQTCTYNSAERERDRDREENIPLPHPKNRQDDSGVSICGTFPKGSSKPALRQRGPRNSLSSTTNGDCYWRQCRMHVTLTSLVWDLGDGMYVTLTSMVWDLGDGMYVTLTSLVWDLGDGMYVTLTSPV